MASEQQTLSDRVHALPPQLFGQILELTITTHPNTVRIDKSYKPPVQLQLDCQSRSAFAASYYTHTAFEFAKEDVDVFCAWAKSLSASHKFMMSTLHVKRDVAQDYHEIYSIDPRDYENMVQDLQYLALLKIYDIGRCIRQRSLGSMRSSLHIEVVQENEEGKLETRWLVRAKLQRQCRQDDDTFSPLKRIRDRATGRQVRRRAVSVLAAVAAGGNFIKQQIARWSIDLRSVQKRTSKKLGKRSEMQLGSEFRSGQQTRIIPPEYVLWLPSNLHAQFVTSVNGHQVKRQPTRLLRGSGFRGYRASKQERRSG